ESHDIGSESPVRSTWGWREHAAHPWVHDAAELRAVHQAEHEEGLPVIGDIVPAAAPEVEVLEVRAGGWIGEQGVVGVARERRIDCGHHGRWIVPSLVPEAMRHPGLHSPRQLLPLRGVSAADW